MVLWSEQALKQLWLTFQTMDWTRLQTTDYRLDTTHYTLQTTRYTVLCQNIKYSLHTWIQNTTLTYNRIQCLMQIELDEYYWKGTVHRYNVHRCFMTSPTLQVTSGVTKTKQVETTSAVRQCREWVEISVKHKLWSTNTIWSGLHWNSDKRHELSWQIM